MEQKNNEVTILYHYNSDETLNERSYMRTKGEKIIERRFYEKNR